MNVSTILLILVLVAIVQVAMALLKRSRREGKGVVAYVRSRDILPSPFRLLVDSRLELECGYAWASTLISTFRSRRSSA